MNAKNSKGSNKGSKKGGGFSVDPKDLGLEENRAKWIKEKNQIIINIGHKQLKLAEKKYGIEHDVFQRLMYEIAFNEYALALVQILSEKHIFSNASEALFEVRTIQNDLSIDTIQFYE